MHKKEAQTGTLPAQDVYEGSREIRLCMFYLVY